MRTKGGLKNYQMNRISEVQDFFNEVVQNLMLADLDNLVTKIPVVPNAGGNCNFPITLFIFSCIEFLGYLTSQELIDDDKDYTKKRVFSYIRDFFDDKYKNQILKNESTFVDVFRHGLSHEFFAKGAGISRDKGVLVGKNQAGILVLSADGFYEAFKLSAEVLKKRISTNDRGVADNLVERYTNLLHKNNKETPINSSGQNRSIPVLAPSIAKPLKSVNGTGTASYPMDNYNN